LNLKQKEELEISTTMPSEGGDFLSR